MGNKRIETMLEKIRKAVSECTCTERETYEALVDEASGWEMRLKELEAEDKK
jgi:hypothetical protein